MKNNKRTFVIAAATFFASAVLFIGLQAHAQTIPPLQQWIVDAMGNITQRISGTPVKINGNLTVTGTCTGCGSSGGAGTGTISTSTAAVVPNLLYFTSASKVGNVATTTLIAGTNISYSGGTPVIIGSSPITINATAGGGTVTNIATTYPVLGGPITTTGTLSLAFGTTTSNLWAGTQTFTNAPIFSALTGVLKGNGSSAISIAANGTDYTLITANTCSAGNHVSAITAAGVITCSADSGGGASSDFTYTTNFGIGAAATSSNAIWGQNSIFASSTSSTVPALAASNSGGGPSLVTGAGNVGIGTTSPTQGLLEVAGTAVVSSASAMAFVVGPSGRTSPALQVDASATGPLDGVVITGGAAASNGATISGTAQLNINAVGSLRLQTSAGTRVLMTGSATAFTFTASNTASSVRFSVANVADAALTAGAEATHTYYNLGNAVRNHASNTIIALQRDFRITGTTHSFTTAGGVITNAAAFSVDGPDSGGTNATISTSTGIYIPTKVLTNVTTGIDLYAEAPTGATNNYAAVLMGTTGIGSSTPGSLLSIGNSGWNFYDNATSTKSGTGGINITTGCYAINGTCLTTSGGGGASTDFTYTTNFGIGAAATSSNAIWGQNSIFASSTSATVPALAASNTTGPAAVFASPSSMALAVGPSGITNPAFQVDASTASSVNGLSLVSSASGSGVALNVISSNANDGLTIKAKGASNVTLDNGSNSNSIIFKTNATNRFAISGTAAVFTLASRGSTAAAELLFTGAGGSNLTASTEAPIVDFNLASAQVHSTGALTLQRDFRVRQSTHSFVAASVLTDAATFSVDGPPIAGTNATITNAHGIYVPSATLTGTVTNSYGLTINAATGASKNFAAQFMGGNVGIGTSSPGAIFSVQGSGGSSDLFEVSTSTGITAFSIDQWGHEVFQMASSTISGAGCTGVNDNDRSGRVVFGGVTACTVTFAHAYQNIPTCTLAEESTIGTVNLHIDATAPVTSAAITIKASGAITGWADYHCEEDR